MYKLNEEHFDVEFNIEDIVRSGVVKEYIIQKTEMGL